MNVYRNQKYREPPINTSALAHYTWQYQREQELAKQASAEKLHQVACEVVIYLAVFFFGVLLLAAIRYIDSYNPVRIHCDQQEAVGNLSEECRQLFHPLDNSKLN